MQSDSLDPARAGSDLETPALAPSRDLVSLTGRRAVVTGAGRGIGAAIAHRLAEAGASVLVSDVDPGLAEARAASLAATGLDVAAVEIDVSDVASADAGAAAATARFGGVDIWVNNAAVLGMTGPVEDADDDAFDRTIAVNLRGAFNGSRAAARAMGDGGVIVNIASNTVLRPIPFATAYVTTKTAIVGMTKALAVELAPRGIRVLAIAPGFVSTPGSREILGLPEPAPGDDPIGAGPLGRSIRADDVALAVLFCASDLATRVTGVVIPVDGGSSI
jgi:NAD(P)-dependent dehydrogenase (short-subunit alcohol dehydrogenase family)